MNLYSISELWRKRILRIGVILFCVCVFLLPALHTFAADEGIVSCTGVADGSNRPICDFAELLNSSNRFVIYLIVIATVGLPVGAGIISLHVIITSGFGSLGQSSNARKYFTTYLGHAVKWYILLLISWLVVNLVAVIFLGKGLNDIFRLT